MPTGQLLFLLSFFLLACTNGRMSIIFYSNGQHATEDVIVILLYFIKISQTERVLAKTKVNPYQTLTLIIGEDRSTRFSGSQCMLKKCKETKNKNSLYCWWRVCIANGFCLTVAVKFLHAAFKLWSYGLKLSSVKCTVSLYVVYCMSYEPKTYTHTHSSLYTFLV